MKLSYVLTACNDNKLYKDFIPAFIFSWEKLYPSITIRILYISERYPHDLMNSPISEHIIWFPILDLDEISTAFISQFIRLLYPAILPNKGAVLITDIDMLPMNKSYYADFIKDIDEDRFVYLRDDLLDKQQIAMCYNVAMPKVWSEIFEITDMEDIVERLKTVYKTIEYNGAPGENGWFTDQQYLYDKVTKWNKKTGKWVVIKDEDTNFKRLDRANMTLDDETIQRIKTGYYDDYHCLRPWDNFFRVNAQIIQLLQLQ